MMYAPLHNHSLQNPSLAQHGSTEGDPSVAAKRHDLEIVALRLTPRFLAVAGRYLACEAECADAVQDAFVAALRHIARFRGTCRLETWVHRILVNVCLMRLRSRSRSITTSLDDRLLPGCIPSRDVLADLAGDDETRQQLSQALRQLPQSQQTVVRLRFFEGFSTAETAQLLGLSPSIVKARLYRAARSLKHLLIDGVSGKVK